MKTPDTHRPWRCGLCLAAGACLSAFPLLMAACETNEGASHTKSTPKETIQTPEGRKTVTTTHEKTTEVTPK